MRKGLLTLLLAATGILAYSQNYHAVNGSSYAGSLGVGNNPASIVNTPFKWDITLFGFQAKNSTNAVSVYNYSLLSSGKNSEYLFTGGDYARFAYANYNINIFNARFAIDRYKAFAFGLNMRGYTNAKTSKYNFIDTVKSSRDFFNLGNINRTLALDAASSNWAEVFATYSQTVWDRFTDRLNAGITLKYNRGLAAGFAKLENGRAKLEVQNGSPYYSLDDVGIRYAYSRNLDQLQGDNSTKTNIKNFFSFTENGSFSADLGVEYLIKSKAVPTVFDHDEEFYDYEWKIGIAVLDIGANKYRYSANSRFVKGLRADIADTTLDDKFRDVSISEFSDSLETIAKSPHRPVGLFTVSNPTRVVINVDRYLGGNFFVNGDLTVNLTRAGKTKAAVQELNLLTITPRWETKRLGGYLPVTVNTQGRMWIGGAFKVGPLLMGIHNWANIFSNKKMNNGGGYLAIVIRPMESSKKRLDKRLDCPTASR